MSDLLSKAYLCNKAYFVPICSLEAPTKIGFGYCRLVEGLLNLAFLLGPLKSKLS